MWRGGHKRGSKRKEGSWKDVLRGRNEVVGRR